MALSIIIISIAFYWLLYETDYLRINLFYVIIPEPIKPKFEAIICATKYRSECIHKSPQYKNRFKCHIIPARTIKAFGHTMHFNEGCNICRAQLLHDIAKVQTSKVVLYPKKQLTYNPALLDDLIPHEVVITDGSKSLTVNGNYKPGMIKQFVKSAA